MNEIKLPFGLSKSDNKLYHISEVARGEACNCVCPSCGQTLIARKGDIREHCFAHKATECEHAYETAIHIFVKEVLEKNKKMALPKHQYMNKPLLYEFDRVELEKSYSEVIPDVVAYKGETPLFIEVYVTHEIDEAKLRKIEKLGISVLEIDVNEYGFDRKDFDKEAVENLIINSTEHKTWLFNRKEEELRKAEAKRNREIQKHKEAKEKEEAKRKEEFVAMFNSGRKELLQIKDDYEKQYWISIILPMLCPECNKQMKAISGEFGYFYLCSCSFKISVGWEYWQDTDYNEYKEILYRDCVYSHCPLCGEWMAFRRNNGTCFLGCTSFPKCKGSRSVYVINKLEDINMIKNNINKFIADKKIWMIKAGNTYVT